MSCVKKTLLLASLLWTSSLSAACGYVTAAEIELLLDKLVEKEVLTPTEARILIEETKQEAARQVVRGASFSIPVWAQKMNLKGDVRLRYELDKAPGTPDRSRARYRLRFSAEPNLIDRFKVGFQLASGGADPRSTNQTLQNSFESPDIRLNYVFAQYLSTPCLSFLGGKFKRETALWQTTDLLWDSDINVEGASAVYSRVLAAAIELFASANAWVLDESGTDSADPMAYVYQAGAAWDLTQTFSLRAGLAYYDFECATGKALDYTGKTNTFDSDGRLVYEYDALSPSLELKREDPAGGALSYVAVFGEYIGNPDPPGANTGYAAGLGVGSSRVKERGQWQLRYLYRYLERDAWLDILPDSDFYGGTTDARGHEVVAQLGLFANVNLTLDYYRAERMTGPRATRDLWQVDLSANF
ncbi:MAG: putative porin [Candidatus Eisenbacteria bacterium]|nr:putative porin [Candidatus Eisenbacteria bacterium]